MAAATAVIFDLGGVVLNSPLAALAEYERRHALPENVINAVIARSGERGAFARLERGEITVDQFAEPFAADCVAAKCEAPLDGAAIMDLIVESATPRPLMLDALATLREESVLVAALTNNFRAARDDDRFAKSLAELAPCFDLIVESAKEGVRKPDPAIYATCCDRLGVRPSACVFLDDIGRNLKPAAALGMRTIRVDSGDGSGAAAIRQLAAMLGGRLGSRLQQGLRLASRL